MILRGALELGEGTASLCGQAELVLPPVRRQYLSRNQPVFVKFLDDPAEITGIQSKLEPDLLRRELAAMGELVHHPRLAQRERGFEQVLIKNLELAGVEAVERANGRDLLGGFSKGHGAPPIFAIVN